MVLTHDGKLIPVCDLGKAKVDSSIFTRGERLFLTCSSLTCKMSRLGSNDQVVVYFEQHFLEPEKNNLTRWKY